MTARLRHIEDSTRDALIQCEERLAPRAAIELLPEPARVIVPVPRRGRMFVRHGAGHGSFSDVTLTSPLRVGEAAPA